MNILVVFPTNIGDALVALPVVDHLRVNYPDARITVFTSPRTDALVCRHSAVNMTVVYDKRSSWRQKVRFILTQYGRYNMVVDLKNSFFPVLLGIWKRTPFIRGRQPDSPAYLWYISLIKRLAPLDNDKRGDILLGAQEQADWSDGCIQPGAIFISTASRSGLKQYPQQHLKTVVAALAPLRQVVLVGEDLDVDYYSICDDIPGVLNLCGRTTLPVLFYILKKFAGLLFSVDTGVMHVGSYCNVPIVALFGPSDPRSYGPWSDKHIVLVNHALDCVPCRRPQCLPGHNKCLDISPEAVIKSCLEVLHG